MKMDIYIDTFRTKEGRKNIIIMGDGYMINETNIKMSDIPPIVSKYNSNLIQKYGNNMKLSYYVDIRGIGMGVYDFLKESEKCGSLNINKLGVASFYYNNGNNVIAVNRDVLSHYHDSSIINEDTVIKMTEIAKGVVGEFNTKIKNELDKLGIIE